MRLVLEVARRPNFRPQARADVARKGGLKWRLYSLRLVRRARLRTPRSQTMSLRIKRTMCWTHSMHGIRIRLWGIDAPEHDQLCRGDDSLPYRCGAAAAIKLDAFIGHRPVYCAPKDIDR